MQWGTKRCRACGGQRVKFRGEDVDARTGERQRGVSLVRRCPKQPLVEKERAWLLHTVRRRLLALHVKGMHCRAGPPQRHEAIAGVRARSWSNFSRVNRGARNCAPRRRGRRRLRRPCGRNRPMRHTEHNSSRQCASLRRPQCPPRACIWWGSRCPASPKGDDGGVRCTALRPRSALRGGLSRRGRR